MAHAVVTGATGGIGRAIALALHEAGHLVTAIGRDPDALAALGERGLHALALDLADTAAIAPALAGLRPDVLVNNAGMMPRMGHYCDLTLPEVERAITVNLTSALAVTHALAPGMRDRGRGHIFFTGSTAGHTPFANLAVYCAAKAAVGAFAQALRLDMATSGVRVTEIVAGRVETGLYRELLPPEARAAMYAGGSAVQPEDVAGMVLSVLAMPAHVDVARFDILPTRQATATGATQEKR